uniref:CCHC-type domain-containing protein n=1 Tax=Nicotiana tabacum TaxID=4097 RepID=A0A1S4D9J0_TOBAC
MSFTRPTSSKDNKSDEELIEEIDTKLKGVDFNRTIPKVIYQNKPFVTTPRSPTAETADQLTVIRADNFEIDWKRFTGILKNWWDNYLSEKNRNQILGATTVATIIKTESGMQVAEQEVREDASATLIYCIAKHFIGEPKLFQDRSLDLCTDLKLKSLIKKDKLQSKTELGCFCQDFGFKTIAAPSKRAKQHKKSSEKSKRRHKRKEKKEGTPKKRRFKRRSKKEHGDKCWSCEKTGHIANECPVTNKKKKKVNTLEIDENVKEKLFAILEQNKNITSSSSSDESYSDSDDEMINMAYNSDNSSSSEEDKCSYT